MSDYTKTEGQLTLSNSFPYRSIILVSVLGASNFILIIQILGQACFVCERDTDALPVHHRCANVKIKTLGGQDLIRHMGTHILFDEALKGVSQIAFDISRATSSRKTVMKVKCPTSQEELQIKHVIYFPFWKSKRVCETLSE